MLNMQTFHTLLSKATQNQDSYLKTLAALTAVNPAELSALASDLAWQDWWQAEAPEATEA